MFDIEKCVPEFTTARYKKHSKYTQGKHFLRFVLRNKNFAHDFQYGMSFSNHFCYHFCYQLANNSAPS